MVACEDGSDSWLIVHDSLDGREAREQEQAARRLHGATTVAQEKETTVSDVTPDETEPEAEPDETETEEEAP